jgi:NAD(P)-dependent dehydrogenase (short-subunit alcohol dehydrogenase family)
MGRLLENRTTVVTGAASGIGRGIARTMAEHGADVVVADVRREPKQGGTPTDELIGTETDANSSFVECDVTERSDLEDAIDEAETFGGVDVMVNNAGIVGPAAGLLELDWTEYRELMEINLDAVVQGTQLAALRMLENDAEGSILNLSSVAGIVGYEGIPPYSAAKGAIRTFTYSVAAELGGEGIRANAIHPGIVDTAMTRDEMPLIGTPEEEAVLQTIPLGRFGRPEDVANTAVYLASDLASYVTGESIVVDGGQTNTA